MLGIAGCGAPPTADEPQSNQGETHVPKEAEVKSSPLTAAPVGGVSPKARPASEPHWETAASGEGDSLFLAAADGKRTITLFCPAGSDDLVVNVTAFRPIGSEERMSFGSGGTVLILVADSRGDRERGGVTGRGPIPAELDAILEGPDGVAINYGAQNSGPHRIGKEAADVFTRGCRD
jgi:hypothetical protein